MNILIIGAGKLGLPLAHQLQQLGHRVTTLSRSKKNVAHGITHLCHDVHDLTVSHFAKQRFDWVYVVLTPSVRSLAGYTQAYVHSVMPISLALADAQVSRLIYISSTQVYGDDAGQALSDDTAPAPSSDYGQILCAAELLWRAHWRDKLTIVRPSGLIDNDLTYLKKAANEMRDIPTHHWLNLIYRQDVVEILASLPAYTAHSPLADSYILSAICQPRHELLNQLRTVMGLTKINVPKNLAHTGKQLYSARLNALLAHTGLSLKQSPFA